MLRGFDLTPQPPSQGGKGEPEPHSTGTPTYQNRTKASIILRRKAAPVAIAIFSPRRRTLWPQASQARFQPPASSRPSASAIVLGTCLRISGLTDNLCSTAPSDVRCEERAENQACSQAAKVIQPPDTRLE